MSENVPNVYSAMQTGSPYKTYRKTILGRVYVRYFDPFLNKPDDKLMSGNPAANEEGCFFDVWSEQEDAFFKRMNANHLKDGVLIPYDRAKQPVTVEVNKYNVMTDEELDELLNSPFFTLQSALNKMTSPAPVYRLKVIAEAEEKSKRLIEVIDARLAELEQIELAKEE